jgi:hypothetical protein
MSDSLPNISIGEFAESLLNSDAIPPLHEAQAPSMPNLPGATNQLDITNVKVPDDFMNEVLGGDTTQDYLNSIIEGSGPQQSIPRPKELPIKENVTTQTERLSALLEQLTVVLSETKQLLSEMSVGTGTGSIGVGPGKKRKRTRKHESRSIADTVEAVLEEIRNGRN